eukprot:g5489.t1
MSDQKLKLYLHFESKTYLILIDGNLTVCDLRNELVAQLRRSKFPRNINVSNLRVSSERKPLLRSRTKLYKVFSDRSDVFLSDTSKVREMDNKPTSANRKFQSTDRPGKAQKSGTNDGLRKTSTVGKSSTRNFEAEAKVLRSKGNFKKARETLEKLQKFDPTNRYAFLEIGEMALHNKQWKRARESLESGVAAYSEDRTMRIRFGDALMGAERYAEAQEHYVRSAQPHEPPKDPAVAAEDAQREGIDQASLLVKIGECMYAQGDEDTGIALYQKVLAEQENNPAALLAYARAAADRGKIEGALQIVLRVLVLRQHHRETRRFLAELLQLEKQDDTPMKVRKGRKPVVIDMGGMDALYSQFQLDSGQLGPAFAFLATVVKDFSAIDQSVKLYEKALSAIPNNACYALNLIHTMELCGKKGYSAALDVFRKFYKANASVMVGGVSCRAILDAMGSIRLTPDGNLYEEENRKEESHHPFVFNEKGQVTSVARLWSNYSFLWSDDDEKNGISAQLLISKKGEALPKPYIPTGKRGVLKTRKKEKEQAVQSGGKKRSPLTEGIDMDGHPSLDLLAIHFTLVKICYAAGLLTVLPKLISLIERARIQCSHDHGLGLYKTTIRNENAYYCCIAQLMGLQDPVACKRVDAQTNQISIDKEVIVFGDSHVLTPAWRCLNVDGETWLLRPALATGVKAWHLRKESTFYPRFNFNRVVEDIADGSTVLFLFCEIDCREGLVLATEKDRYADIAEGISTVVDIYVRVLLEIVEKKKIQAYVHPVVPVLDVTRAIVLAFNLALRSRIEQLNQLQWVDIAHQLTVDCKGERKLRTEFELDGTHLGPEYLKLLENELGKK